MKIEIITHYAKEDKDFSSDYYSVDVKINGKIVEHFSDHYHEKGKIRAEEFVRGIQYALGADSVTVTLADKADDKT